MEDSQLPRLVSCIWVVISTHPNTRTAFISSGCAEATDELIRYPETKIDRTWQDMVFRWVNIKDHNPPLNLYTSYIHIYSIYGKYGGLSLTIRIVTTLGKSLRWTGEFSIQGDIVLYISLSSFGWNHKPVVESSPYHYLVDDIYIYCAIDLYIYILYILRYRCIYIYLHIDYRDLSL